MTFAVLLACAGSCWQRSPTVSSASPDEAAAKQSSDGRPSGPIELFGINEAISVPGAILQRQRPDLATVSRLLREDAEAVAAVGARWVRAHTAVYPNHHHERYRSDPAGTIERLDTWMQAAQSQDLQALVMLSPWSGNRTHEQTAAYVLSDAAGYLAYVDAVVERYDGDGVADMPGLTRPVKHWEVDNEPDLKNTGSPRNKLFDPQGFCAPEQYAHVLRSTADAIRSADPEAKVMNGGLYRPQTPGGKEYLDALFALPGVQAAIDVQSQHAYHQDESPRAVERAIAHARAAAPGLPIWITETNVPSEGDGAHLDRVYQAEQLVLTHAVALEQGVERVFWHTLADPPSTARTPRRGIMDNHSLYASTSDGFVRKPAGEAYARLAAFLEGKTWEELDVSSEDGATVIALGDRWLLHGEGRVTLALPATRAERARDGEALELLAREGAVTVDLSGGAALLHR